jgi:hypothetical protein
MAGTSEATNMPDTQTGRQAPRRDRNRGRRVRRWSKQVAERSDALDLERGIFTRRSPRAIAQSLKHSAEQSRRRKAGPFQSAMSMLNLYINRAGRTLSTARRRTLERAKHELRIAFGKAGARDGSLL